MFVSLFFSIAGGKDKGEMRQIRKKTSRLYVCELDMQYKHNCVCSSSDNTRRSNGSCKVVYYAHAGCRSKFD